MVCVCVCVCVLFIILKMALRITNCSRTFYEVYRKFRSHCRLSLLLWLADKKLTTHRCPCGIAFHTVFWSRRGWWGGFF